MKLIKALFATLLTAYACFGADQITATITFTNTPADADTITVNASVRTWKDTVVTPATQVATSTNANIAGSNLFTHVASYPFTTLALQRSSTNGIKLTGLPGQALAVTLSTAYAEVSYSTSTVTDARIVRVPLTVEATGPRAQIASEIATGLSDYSTNSLNESNLLVTNLVGRANTQTIGGVKTFTGANIYSNASQTISGGTVTNVTIYGTAARLSGFLTNITGSGLTLTNVAVYGGLSSYGSGANSLVLGGGADASGSLSISIGNDSESSGDYSIALGYTAVANAENGTAVGYNSGAQTNATALGVLANAFASDTVAIGLEAIAGNETSKDATGAMAVGAYALADYPFSVGLGYASTPVRSNQVMLGSVQGADASVTIPNIGYVVTNLVVGGTDGATIVAGLLGGITLGDGTVPTANPTNQSVLVSVSGELLYRTPTTSEGAGANNRVHNRAEEVNGSGSDYTLTASYARVDFGGTDPQVTLPTAGTYIVKGIVSLETGAVAADQYYFKLYNSTDAADIANSEAHSQPDATAAHAQVIIESIVTVTGSKTLQIYGKNDSAARGSVESIHTKLIYIRLY